MQSKTYSNCSAVLSEDPTAPSGYYNILLADGSVKNLYCDLEGIANCGSTPGWNRLLHIDLKTDPDVPCPEGLQKFNFSDGNYTVCGRPLTDSATNCTSIILPSVSTGHTEVCGQLRGYQYGTLLGLTDYNNLDFDRDYLDGVGITQGMNPRTHIWSYIMASIGGRPEDHCPCATDFNDRVPVAIINAYYCE